MKFHEQLVVTPVKFSVTFELLHEDVVVGFRMFGVMLPTLRAI